MRSRVWIASLACTAMALASSGCELLVDFDRSRIDAGGGDATAEDGGSDAGDSAVPLETGTDASDAQTDTGADSFVADTGVEAASDGAASDGPSTDGAPPDGGEAGALLADGATCSMNAQCQSGACVGTVCCHTACSDTGAASCGTNGQCLANGSACAKYPVGTVCTAAACVGNSAQQASTCNAAGTCAAGASVACAPYKCTAGACGTTCSSDLDCTTGSFCNGSHACTADLAPGAACTGNDQCTSGACGTTGSGSCCTSACSPVGGTCGATGCAAGSGACQFPGASTTCNPGCAGHTLTTFGCNGAGACSTTGGSSASCAGNLLCASSTTCLTGCGSSSPAGDANCVTGFYCDGVGAGACQPDLGAGSTCQRATQCSAGVCTGNLCDPCHDGVKDVNETDVDCGGGTCGACGDGKVCAVDGDCQSVHCVSGTCAAADVVMVGMGASSSAGAELHPSTQGNGTWSSPVSLGAPSVSDLGLTFLATGASPQAAGIARYTKSGDPLDQALVYTTWTPGAFAAFAAVASGVTTREVPAIAAAGGQGFVTFQGTDFNQYFALLSGGTWAPTAEAITTGGGLPTPAGIAAIGTTATVAYFGAGPGNDPTAQDRTTSWQAAVGLGTDASFVATPSIVAMNGGSAELLTVYIRASDGALTFDTRTAGTWSGAAQIPGALAPVSTTYGPVERVALAALPGGEAIAAWRDATTNAIDYSVYSGSSWSAAPLSFPAAVTLSAAPALAHGVAGAMAEIAYVDGAGAGWHARLVGSTWTAPVQVFPNATVSHVAIASCP